jgi:hypothetical protein
MAEAPDTAHCRMVANRLLAGAVVPFLGAGVNLCGRPDPVDWQHEHYLPSGGELAQYLPRAAGVEYPYTDGSDLLRVSQYVDVSVGPGALYDALHLVFDDDYSPTPVHRLLAELPALIRRRAAGRPCFYPLNITTNYDDLLERAFREAGEEFDLLTYIANGDDSGKFRHTRPDGTSEVILVPNSYAELRCDSRPVIAKIHGAVARGPEEEDSFDYLSHTDIAKLIPVNVLTRMRKSNFLFLGYSLRDWNLRVILHRLWGTGGLSYQSWAITPHPDRLEEKAWSQRRVDLLNARLEEYIVALRHELASVEPGAMERSEP